MLIKPTVLRSGNRQQTRMDTRLLNQLRRLMLYPTELRAAAKTVALSLSFLHGLRSATQIHFIDRYALSGIWGSVRGFDSLHPLHLKPRQCRLFPGERNVQPSTAGRDRGHEFTDFSRIYSEAQP